MTIKNYCTCVFNAVVRLTKAITYAVTLALLIFCLPMYLCYTYLGIEGIIVGCIVSILLMILVGLIEDEITRFKRWHDDY